MTVIHWRWPTGFLCQLSQFDKFVRNRPAESDMRDEGVVFVVSKRFDHPQTYLYCLIVSRKTRGLGFWGLGLTGPILAGNVRCFCLYRGLAGKYSYRVPKGAYFRDKDDYTLVATPPFLSNFALNK